MANEIATQLLTEAIAEGATPGAVYLTGNRGGVIAQKAIGHLTYAPDAPRVTPETIYDLDSLTKVIVMTPLVMLLYE